MGRSKLLAICSRSRWTVDKGRAVVDAAKTSGLALTEFAHQHGIDPQRLYHWRRRLSTAPVAAETPMLVELKRIPRHEPIEIELRNGRIVRVADAFEANTLRRVVEVLEAIDRTC